jgi:type I restriction enzyme M protein
MNGTEVKLPKWLENRYGVLWNEFKDRSFKAEEAEKVLTEKGGVERLGSGFAMLLSDLKRAGWITAELDPEDSRRRIYKLKSKDDIISDALSLDKESLTRSDIEGILKKAADLIRTRVDYKFILILLFIKRISDKWEADYGRAYKEAKDDGLSDEDAKKEAGAPAYHDFDFPQEYLWDEIRKDVSTLPEKLSKALKVLAEKNPELKDVLDNMDFIQFTSNRENTEILRQLVELFSERKLHHVSADILGDAYEWVLKFFAPQKAKEGEVYTPREVIKVLVEMLDPQPGESVYDPACGSGGMLIVSYKHVEDNKGKKEADKLFLHGQEANNKTLAFGKMNMYIHDIRNVKLMGGDTLLFPKFKEASGVTPFDIVIANPPWNQDGYGEEVIKKGEFWKQRFGYGFVPNQSADWVWIQHMLASSKGRVGVVIDNGCLFRGGKEQVIRSRVLEEDLLEAVILLPEKLFYNTGAPGAILILNKNKAADRKGKVLFINASETFEKHPDVRKLNTLSDANIDKISKAYHEFKEEAGFSEAFSLDEIKKNDYNLNVSLYVYPDEEREEIDVKKEWGGLKKIEAEIEGVNRKIEVYLKEIE